MRQLHAVCRLLDAEAKPPARTRAVAEDQSTAPSRPHGFARVLTALCVLVAAALGTGFWWWSRPALHRVVDYRLGVKYTTSDATDAVVTTDGQSLLLGTAGGGLHRIHADSHRIEHHNTASTRGGLLSDDIRRIDRDARGRLYFLCQQDEHLGLARATDKLDQWNTLLGVNRFTALDVPNPEGEISAAAVNGAELWVGTRSGGVGRYHLRDHAWQESITASADGLLDNHVRDLVTDSTGSIWIATATGINRYQPQTTTWQRFTTADGLAGADVVRLRWFDEALWYVTAAGGLGRIDAAGNTTLIQESGWGQHDDSEIAAIAADPQARLWFATEKGDVGRYDPVRRQWLDLGLSPVTGTVRSLAIPQHPQAAAWLGTDRELLRWTSPSGDAPGTWQVALPAGVDQIDAQGTSVVARMTPGADQPFTAVNTSSDGTNWQTVVGGRGLHIAARNITAATFDAEQQRLWVATERGLASYDTRTNDWTGDFPLAGVAAARLTDVGLADETPVVLGTDHEIRRLSLPDGKWESLLGGGKFEATEADISAVTRDSSGRLWIGTQAQGVFVYDTARHRWEPRLTFSKPVEALQASAGLVWLLSQGAVYTITADRVIQPLSAKLPEVASIAAAPHTPSAVLQCRPGQVYLANDQRQLRMLVGDAVPGWDPTTAPTVGILNELVVFGGDRPHWYDLTTRHWQPLSVGPVLEIVSALNALWLRTSTGVVRLAADRKLEAVPQTESVVALAGTADQLVVLSKDGLVRVRHRDNANWVTLNDVPNGPKASLFQEANWSAACLGDALYLSGDKDGEAWLFHWKTQQWQRLTSSSAPLKQIMRLQASGDKVFALDQKGVLHERQGGELAAIKALENVVAVQATNAAAVATTKSGSVSLRRADGWQPILGQPAAPSLGTPRRAITALGGLVVAGTEGTAWLSDNLNEWREMPALKNGKFTVEEFRASEDGRALWAITTQRRLFTFDNTGWSWKDVLPEKLTVESATVVARPNQAAELWVCTQDGAVHRVQGEKVTPWSQPTAAPGSAAEMAGVVAVTNGFVAAFTPGRMAYFSALTRTWTELPSPAGKQRLAELVALGPGAEGCCLLRTQGGELYGAALVAAPVWETVATDVSSLCVQDSIAWAVTSASVLQVPPKGDVRKILSASGWEDIERGSMIAACEFPLEDGNAGLAVGFTNRLALYDPATHTWSSQALPVKSITPIEGGLLVLDSRGQVSRGQFQAGRLALEPVKTDTHAVAISSTASASTWIGLQEDGAVSQFDGDRVHEQWIGRAWSGNPTQSRIADFATLGQWFFFLDKGGRLHAYDRDARDWQTLDEITGGKKVVAGETGVWIETAGPDKSQLWWLTRQAQTWTAKSVADDIVRWHAGPHGVLLVSKRDGRLQEAFLRDNGDSTPAALSVAPGPEDREIVGTRLDQNQLWLRSSHGTLWNYRPDTRRWTEFPLDPQSAVETVRFAGDRIWAHEVAGGLWMGQADATEISGWRFTSALAEIKSFDATADHLITTTTGSHAAVRDPHAAMNVPAKAIRDFSSRAWMKNDDRLSWAAARDDALVAVTQSRSAARYQLSTRQWETLPAVPAGTSDLFAADEWCVIGAKEELFRLQNNQWSVVTPRSETTWRDGETTHTIDAQGRWSRNADIAPVEPAPPRVATTSAAPLRVHAGKTWLLLELSDGSLWRYDAAIMELTRLIPPAVTGRKRTGLVTAANAIYFLTEDDPAGCSRVSKDGQLTRIELPETLASVAWAPLIHAEGLLLVGPQAGVMIDADNTPQPLQGAALTAHKSQAKPIDAARHRQSGHWRMASETAQASSRLECQFDTDWQPVPIDWIRGRMLWDIVTGGLSVAKHVVLVTSAGIVIRSAEEAGLPRQFLPIDWSTGANSGGRVWSLSADQCLVRANDGRKWHLKWNDTVPPRLEPYVPPPSAWTIGREGEKLSLRANFGRGEPLPVQIDKNGRLDCDTVTSVAVYGDSAWLATAAGLFEYALDLQELRDVQPFGACELLASADRKRLFVRRDDGTLLEKDGSKWKPTTAKWNVLVAESRLSDRQPGAPLEWELNLGRDRTAPQKVRYVGRALSIDTPLPAKRLPTEASDATRVYTLTSEGLVIRSLSGEWIGLLPLNNAEGLAWIQETDQSRVLVVQGADRSWRIDENVAVPLENAAALKTPRVIWRGRVCQGIVDEGSQRIELRSGTEVVDVLDLKERGFTRDRVSAVHWDGTAAWLIGPATIECRKGDGMTLTHTNPLGLPVRIVQEGHRAWLTDDKQLVELKPDGSLGRVASLADSKVEERAATSAFWRGDTWRMARAGSATGLPAAVEYRNAATQWLRGELDSTGLNWDRFLAAAAADRTLVVSTAAGDFTVASHQETTLANWRVISQPTEMVTVTKPPTQFWTSAAGDLWKHCGDNWFRYDAAGPQWSPVPALPPEVQSERQVLSRSPRSAWVRTAASVEYVELDQDRQPVRSALASNGTLPSAFVRAVLPLEKSLWLLTQQDLRQVDATTGELLQVGFAATDVTRGEFRAAQSEWSLRLQRGTADQVVRLVNQRWDPVNLTDSPFAPAAQESTAGLMRVRPTADGLTAELRETSRSDRWHPVKFVPAFNRFDFQVAQDAVSNGERALTRTAAGVVAWQFIENQWRLGAFHPLRNRILAPASTQRLLVGGADNRWEEWDAQNEWQPTRLSGDELGVIARSDRWSVQQEDSRQGIISVQVTKNPAVLTDLPLDARGDFEFRRPSRIAATADGAVWTASLGSVTRYAANRGTDGAPDSLTTFGRPADKPVTDLFVVADATHAEVDGKWLRFQSPRGWEAVDDRTPVEEQRRVLADGAFTSWSRGPNGRLVGTMKVGDTTRLASEWDTTTGRFRHDQVQSAAATAQGVWFTHPAGLSRVSVKDGHRDVSLLMSTAPKLLDDRRLGAWLVEHPDTQQVTKLEWDADKAELVELKDTSPLVAGPEDRFRDAEWHFDASGISWRDRPARLTGQRFAHDHFQSLAQTKNQFITATPAGMIVWDRTTSPWSITATIPPPLADGNWTINVEDTQLRAIERTSQRRFEWTLPDGPWREVGAGETTRTLVDTARWTWQQDLQGRIAVRLHAADELVEDPLVNRDGRFPWDDVTTVLSDGDDVWTGGRHGIVRRALQDGEPRRWYRSGSDGDQSRPFGAIVQLGRFDEKEHPVASWDAADRVASSSLMALDEHGGVWQFKGSRDSGEWRLQKTNPWSIAGGQRQMHHPLLESFLDQEGQLRLQYTATSPAIPVLRSGRLSLDTVRDITLTDDGQLMLATSAGVVLAGRETAAFQRLWTDSTNPQELRDARHLVRARSVQDQDDNPLWVRDASGVRHEFDPASQQWRRLTDVADTPAWDERLVHSDLWTWARDSNGISVQIHPAGPASGPWSLFHRGQFSFDVLRDFRLHEDQLVAATPGGIAWFEADTMQLQRLDRSHFDADTGLAKPLLTVLHFAGDGSLDCFDETHRYRFHGGQWTGSLGQERIAEHSFASDKGHWQVQPTREGTAGGFQVLQFDPQGLLISERRILRGVEESRLKRVVPGAERLWLCLDRGVYFVDARP
ncbi:MAG TPA: hypothetical protein VFG20_03550 [Planctomycetaceae bacterium]|nr:hypothetical protein [Planctomycetaceae bacterium]